MTEVDPAGAGSSAEFVSLLRRRREVTGLSYRELARRARLRGVSLPPSTAATMLGRSTLPSRGLVAAYVRACGGDEGEVAAWLAVRARVANGAVILSARSRGVGYATASGASGSPRQLPPDVAGIVGRERELSALDAAIGGPGPGLMVVTGPAGVGKSTLAIYWAHRAGDRFPDGQLYVDLRGHGPRAPLPVAAALTQLLAGLGVPADAVPADEQQAAGLFRSMVADRRILVVLDGAVSADQVRLLRPGASGSGTVVTSRDRLVGLTVRDGAREVPVPTLDRSHAVRLLAQAAGEDAVAAESTAAGALVDLCDGVPLAVRIAAAVLDRRARTPIADLAARIRDCGRLTALAVPGDRHLALETVVGHSYQALDDATQNLFRLLGATPAAAFTPASVAEVTRTAIVDARSALCRLADQHLLSQLDGDRYTMPGLLREYAHSVFTDVEKLPMPRSCLPTTWRFR